MTQKGTECNRCGGTFQVLLCSVHEGDVPGEARDRVEAYLCYRCRSETAHEVLE